MLSSSRDVLLMLSERTFPLKLFPSDASAIKYSAYSYTALDVYVLLKLLTVIWYTYINLNTICKCFIFKCEK